MVLPLDHTLTLEVQVQTLTLHSMSLLLQLNHLFTVSVKTNKKKIHFLIHNDLILHYSMRHFY